MSAVWYQTYFVYSFLVSRQGRLSLYGLLNILQDASIAHAAVLGHGFSDARSRGTLWVLTRQKVAMKKWPSWNEAITVRTWVRPAEGAFAVRDFEVLLDGTVIGEATTSWLLLNAETRKPLREALGGYDAGPGRVSFDSEKLHAREECVTLARFEVRNSDIDGNKHVNNTRYSQWILDAIPIEWHSQYMLQSYAVNFLAETRLGDAIDVQTVRSENNSFFQGRRSTDGKVVFTASLHIAPIV